MRRNIYKCTGSPLHLARRNTWHLSLVPKNSGSVPPGDTGRWTAPPLFQSRMHASSPYSTRAIIHAPTFSSVASPICQEGQSERTFPILAFSRFSSFLPDFPLFFPIFGKFFAVRGATLPPWPPIPSGYATAYVLHRFEFKTFVIIWILL